MKLPDLPSHKSNAQRYPRWWLIWAIAISCGFSIVILSYRTHSLGKKTSASQTVPSDALPDRDSNTITQHSIADAKLLPLNRARRLIAILKEYAKNTNDLERLVSANTALLAELRSLGPYMITACIESIADKTSPESLRILLLEIVASTVGHSDERVAQLLMTIIADPNDSKNIRMRALQWIPETGRQSDGTKLVELLSSQKDPDLEFGLTRSLRGFKVAEGISALSGELAENKDYLTRIAAYHALAKQGNSALQILQESVTMILAKGSRDDEPAANAVAVHGILSLAELPDPSSLALIESISENPSNSIAVRSTAFDVIASIGGPKAQAILRNALKNETNESILVYIAHSIAALGDASDAPLCQTKALTVSDAYTKNELLRAANTLRQK